MSARAARGHLHSKCTLPQMPELFQQQMPPLQLFSNQWELLSAITAYGVSGRSALRTHTHVQPKFAYIFPLNQCLKASLLLIISLYDNLGGFMRVKALVPFAKMSMIFWIFNILSVVMSSLATVLGLNYSGGDFFISLGPAWLVRRRALALASAVHIQLTVRIISNAVSEM